MLMDLSRSDERWNISFLRYFNPFGVHSSGRIGEDPTKPYFNLMPYITQVALGNKLSLTIFGDDYTPDETGTFYDFVKISLTICGRRSRLHSDNGIGIRPKLGRINFAIAYNF